MLLERLLRDNGKLVKDNGEQVKEKSLGVPYIVTLHEKDLSSIEKERKAIHDFWEVYRKNDKGLDDANAYCKGNICMSFTEGKTAHLVYEGKIICSVQFYKI